MTTRIALLIGIATLATTAAQAETASVYPSATAHSSANVPASTDDRYRAAFNAIESEQWDDATRLISALPQGQMKNIATAELYLAANSPRVELGPLLSLLNEAPDIPQAEQLARLAQRRGATVLPRMPQRKSLRYVPGPDNRRKPDSVRNDAEANNVRSSILSHIKNDDPMSAQAILDGRMADMTSEGRTELEQRIAWSYYIENMDSQALAMARRAQAGSGSWVIHADWVAGLAAWRLNDCRTAADAFDKVALRSGSDEMRAAGYYWAMRSHVACGSPDQAQSRLQKAARYDGTFYGILSAEVLGMNTEMPAIDMRTNAALERNPNIATAMNLADIGQIDLADEVLKHQAQTGPDADHGALVTLARKLGLPRTQLYLAHNAPHGYQPQALDQYPVANWQPDRGWRVDPALVFAHALQESRFQHKVVSPAGARGLMQVMPGTARVIAREKGLSDGANLFRASTNLEYGQSYLEMLRDMSTTGGLLPKVAAAYNAGPAPVQRWNSEIKGGTDPLLYIESIPYYETREYVAVIMRNYWMYQRSLGTKSDTLTELSQYRWPRFPQASAETIRQFSQR